MPTIYEVWAKYENDSSIKILSEIKSGFEKLKINAQTSNLIFGLEGKPQELVAMILQTNVNDIGSLPDLLKTKKAELSQREIISENYDYFIALNLALKEILKAPQHFYNVLGKISTIAYYAGTTVTNNLEKMQQMIQEKITLYEKNQFDTIQQVENYTEQSNKVLTSLRNLRNNAPKTMSEITKRIDELKKIQAMTMGILTTLPQAASELEQAPSRIINMHPKMEEFLKLYPSLKKDLTEAMLTTETLIKEMTEAGKKLQISPKDLERILYQAKPEDKDYLKKLDEALRLIDKTMSDYSNSIDNKELLEAENALKKAEVEYMNATASISKVKSTLDNKHDAPNYSSIEKESKGLIDDLEKLISILQEALKKLKSESPRKKTITEYFLGTFTDGYIDQLIYDRQKEISDLQTKLLQVKTASKNLSDADKNYHQLKDKQQECLKNVKDCAEIKKIALGKRSSYQAEQGVSGALDNIILPHFENMKKKLEDYLKNKKDSSTKSSLVKDLIEDINKCIETMKEKTDPASRMIPALATIAAVEKAAKDNKAHEDIQPKFRKLFRANELGSLLESFGKKNNECANIMNVHRQLAYAHKNVRMK